MRKTLVILCFMCIALGQWHQEDEIQLPKGIQVNDLTLSSTGELYLLSASSILKYDTGTKKPFLVQEIRDGQVLAVHGDEVYVVDNARRLCIAGLNSELGYQTTAVSFDAPEDIIAATVNDQTGLIVKETGKITFATDKSLVGSIGTPAEDVRTIPSADYNDKATPFFTLSGNRIYTWSGGTFINPENYIQHVTYSASHNIVDFAPDGNGNLYVLFSDSILYLDAQGTYRSKTTIPTVSANTELLVNPQKDNSIVLYDPMKKSLIVISAVRRPQSEELIVLRNNQPNPVDNYTEIAFTIAEPLELTITIYNLIGEPVKVVTRDRYPKGTHRITWNASDERGNLVPNGIYFYRLESAKGVAIKQLIVLR